MEATLNSVSLPTWARVHFMKPWLPCSMNSQCSHGHPNSISPTLQTSLLRNKLAWASILTFSAGQLARTVFATRTRPGGLISRMMQPITMDISRALLPWPAFTSITALLHIILLSLKYPESLAALFGQLAPTCKPLWLTKSKPQSTITTRLSMETCAIQPSLLAAQPQTLLTINGLALQSFFIHFQEWTSTPLTPAMLSCIQIGLL